MPVASLIVRYLLVSAAIAAGLYSLLLARAQYLFQEDTLLSVSAAVRLVPYNSAYVARLGSWKPKERVALLERAVALNPFDSQSWIQLGLYSELQAHDLIAAERYYRKAAEVNHMYLPKWTLTNFYFRHGREPEFFRWAEATLAITPYSPDPVFTQMWLMTSDPARIASAVPNRPETLLRYAWFLVNNGHEGCIAPIVQRLIAQVGGGNPRTWGRDDLIATIEDRLLADGQAEPAMQIWSSMHRGGWVSQPVPTATHPLSNGDFSVPFYPHGFDWAPLDPPGIAISHYTDQSSVRFEFSGDEAEHSVLMQEYIPVAKDGSYLLTWHAVSEDISSPSGLVWHLHQIGAEKDLQSGDLLDAQSSWRFHVAPAVSLGRLALDYSRPMGSVRARGSIVLTSVAILPQ
ncbi:MAG: hypothetical protein JO319_09205 [Acidobacteriaceae bacterium]|nr:hypothetical protein [Acidobacteriaceae bacterium]